MFWSAKNVLTTSMTLFAVYYILNQLFFWWKVHIFNVPFVWIFNPITFLHLLQLKLCNINNIYIYINNCESVTNKSSYLTKWDYRLLGRTNLHMSGFDLMGCDSWFATRFWISQINSLLSRVFSWQDKNIKINGIFDGSVTL